MSSQRINFLVNRTRPDFNLADLIPELAFLFDNILVWSGWLRWVVASLFEWSELMVGAELGRTAPPAEHDSQYTNINTQCIQIQIQIDTNTSL